AFAVLVGVVTAESARRWGRAAGLAAGWSLLAMPRVFAHAHFGALDTFLSLFWTLALLTAARAMQSSRWLLPVAVAGAVWSLALLTKIHAWLLLPIVTLWALANLPWRRAAAAVSTWAALAVGLFFLGWPWLWYDTWT